MKTNFCVVADTHYYNVEALGKNVDKQPKTLNESGAIIDAAFDIFIKRENCDLLLIAGDLTCNGERESHDAFVEKLRKIQNAGKKVFVITSTHDFEQQINENKRKDGRYVPVTLTESGEWNATLTTRDELRSIYNDFGFKDAIAEYDSLSYVAQIAAGLRVLMLNDDGNWHSFCGFDEGHLEWILTQIREAKKVGDDIFAVVHHPMMPAFFFQHHFSRRDMHGDFEKVRNLFADNGVHLVFTGHTHMHNIAHHTTPNGNLFTDINTASLVSYPAPMRFCSYENGVLDVHTETVNDFDWDKGGLSAQEYLKKKYDYMPSYVINSAATDFEEFAVAANGFSVKREKIENHKLLIKCVGRFLRGATLGSFGRLLFCYHKLPIDVRKIKIVDLCSDLIRNMSMGNGNYTEDEPVVAALFLIAGQLDKLFGKKMHNTFFKSFSDFIQALLFDDGVSDWETQISL